MSQRFFAVIASTTLILAPNTAVAWNNVGHLAVAKLAYERLSDRQKTKLFALLRGHPHYKQFLAAGRPESVSEIEWVIVRSAVWPDWVRPRSADTRGAEVTRYHRPEDHYVNVPLINARDADAFAGKTLVNPDLTNILDALKQRSNEMKTKAAAAADKAVAACWIFHLIGDIHQPLHNITYFSDTKAFRRGDLGGNLFGIRAGGQRVKLHAFWDNLLGDDPNYADDSSEHQSRIFREAIKVAEGLRGKVLTNAEQDQLNRNTTFASWSQESFELAKNVAYRKSDGTGLLAGAPVPFKGGIPASAPEVGDEYVKMARAVAETRVVMAGERLATRMQKLLGK